MVFPEMFLQLLSDDVDASRRCLIDRRVFLKIGAVTAAACLFPENVLAGDGMSSFKHKAGGERALSFHNTHTGEKIEGVYRTGGKYIPEVLAKINHILRDHRTGQVRPIDFRLLELLFDLSRKVNARQPFHIISGYRSPRTNSLLRKNNSGVACNSFHIKGKAIDIRIPGIDLSVLRKAALSLRGGGVGYYRRSNFLHLDTGHFRYW
jgi:uncharacterized protein YcbK (DUF882 family)